MNIAEPGLNLGQPPGGYGPPGGPPGGWGPPGGGPPGGWGPPGGGAPPGGVPPGGWGPPPGGPPPGGPPPGAPPGGPPPGAPPGGWGGGYGQPPGYGPPPGYAPYAPPAAYPGGPPGAQGAARAFSPGDAITFAWERLKADPGTILATIIVGFLLMWIVGFIGGFVGNIVGALAGAATTATHHRGMAPTVTPFYFGMLGLGGFIWLGFQLLNFVVSSFFTAGLVSFALKVARGAPYAFGDLFGGAPFFLPVLAANFIIMIAVAIGVVFLIVPGVMLALGLWMTSTCIVDRNLGPIDALSESWRLTDGNKLNLFVFWLLSIGLAIAGACACGVGLFLVMPLLLIAHAYIYLKLSGQQVAAVARAA
jgi:uncharacterized membrane protein